MGQKYIVYVQSVFSTDEIMGSLCSIIKSLKNDDGVYARTQIQELSSRLRHHLYELKIPELPSFKVERTNPDGTVAIYLISKKCKTRRRLLTQLLFLAIAVNMFLFAPSELSTAAKMLSCATMFGAINILYLGCRILFRRVFLPSRNLRVYGTTVLSFTLLTSLPVIWISIIENSEKITTHSAITGISVFISLGIFIVGISGMLYIREWLKSRVRYKELRYMATQEEMYFLRKQINPHFLFNMLNNAELSSYTNPEISSQIMEQLKELLEYQFNDTTRMEITVRDEVRRLEVYLRLESYRMDNFQFSIQVSPESTSRKNPSLLLLTFIENAVKHSRNFSGYRFVDVNISTDNQNIIEFEVRNNIGKNQPENAVGGIGLFNTIRRLDIIYDDSYTLNANTAENIYKVELNIPALCWTV